VEIIIACIQNGMEFEIIGLGKSKLRDSMKHSLLISLIFISVLFSSMLDGGGWREGVPLNTPREGAASVSIGNYIYMFGGRTLYNRVLNTVERFDVNTGIWDTTIASFNTPRTNAAAIVFNDNIFLAGGRDASGDVIDSVQVYYPAQNSWQSAHAMRKRREGHALAFFNNRIYAIGGQDESNYVDDIEWYDDSTDQWEEAPFKMPANSERSAFYSAVVRDTFYMCGGFYYGPTNDSYIKPPLTLDWIQGPNMAGARAGGASALLGDRLFMMGGITGQSIITDLVEIYDINNWQIISGPSLPTARMGMTAVTLNEEIYVIGGVISQQGPPTTLVQVYSDLVGIFDSGNPNLIKSAYLIGYPNPFNSTIEFKLEIPRSGVTSLAVYDLQGRTIKQLVNEPLRQGTHFFSWDAEDSRNQPVASGIYFAILRGDSFYQTFKIFHVK
jgi:hypothetical protein